jgi:hypothetical protein
LVLLFASWEQLWRIDLIRVPRTPNGLDWAVHVKRPGLVQVIRDYFDVLWDVAVKILDSGEITAEGAAALDDFEAEINRPRQP